MCGLSVPSNWNDRPNDISQRNWDNLKLAYDDVADIDAFTGGVSEEELGILYSKNALAGLFTDRKVTNRLIIDMYSRQPY